jgi:hypothetical protein
LTCADVVETAAKVSRTKQQSLRLGGVRAMTVSWEIVQCAVELKDSATNDFLSLEKNAGIIARDPRLTLPFGESASGSWLE